MKEKLKNSLKYLKDEKSLTAADVSLEMGYKKNYISEMLSPKGIVTEKFMNAFNSKYKDILENRNIHGQTTLTTFTGETKENLIALTASVKILVLRVKELESLVKGEDQAKVSLRIDRLIAGEAKQMLDELRSE